MATPVMDAGILNFFSPLFVLLFIFALFYALFQWSKLFGDNKIIHAILALVIGLFGAIFSQSARDMIEYIIPWFTFLMIFGVMIIVIFKMFGVSDDSLTTAVKSPGVMWTILIIAIVVVLGALSSAFGQKQLGYTTDVQDGNGDSAGSGDGQTGTDTGIIDPGNPGTSDTASGNFEQNLGATFYNPKVLGMLFILLIAAVGVKMLTMPTSPPT
jgi:hypothetical protein